MGQNLIAKNQKSGIYEFSLIRLYSAQTHKLTYASCFPRLIYDFLALSLDVYFVIIENPISVARKSATKNFF